jgi:RNA polymerase sigma factor (sigma-70 family)
MIPNALVQFVRHLRRSALVLEDAEQTDGQLLEAFVARRDGRALEVIVRRHALTVWGVCRRTLANHHDAEDAFQATFLVLVRRASSIRTRELLANWLYGVALKTASKARQMAAKRSSREKQVNTMLEPQQVDSPDGALDSELRAALDEELSRLPQKYRTAILLCDLQGRTRGEVARELRLPEGTVASRLARARGMLAQRLARRGLAVSVTSVAALCCEQAAYAALPEALLTPTIGAVRLVAAGQTVPAGLLSTHVTQLSGAVLHAITPARWKAAANLLVLAALALGGGLVIYHILANQPNRPELPAETPPSHPVLQVQASIPGASAEEIEEQVTVKLEETLAGMPGLKRTFSRSQFGLATIDLHFDAGTDYHKDRDEVINRLNLRPALPAGVQPVLTPSRQGSAVALRYTLINPRTALGDGFYTLSDLRTLQEYIIEREFRRLPGVADVLTAGGAVKRYEVMPDPERLKRYGISSERIFRVLEISNGRIGGSKDPMEKALTLETAKEAAAYLREQEQVRCREIRDLLIGTINDVPIRMDDVVDGGPLPSKDAPGTQGVVVGHRVRLGRVSFDQARTAAKKPWRISDDVVEGIILVRQGADVPAAAAQVLAKIRELNESPGRLLPGLKIEPCPADNCFFLCGTFPSGVSQPQARALVQAARNVIREFGEVQACISHLGAVIDGEPLPEESAELCVILSPLLPEGGEGSGVRGKKLSELMQAMQQGIERQLPGTMWTTALTSSAETDPFSPARGELVVKVFGPDLDKLGALADKIKETLAEVKGVDQSRVLSGLGPVNLEFVVDKEKCKRWGLKVEDVSAFISATVKPPATRLTEGEKVYDVQMRLPFDRRDDDTPLLEMPVVLPDMGLGPRIPLKELVSPVGPDGQPDPKRSFTRLGATTIYHEQGKRLVAVKCRVQGRTPAEVQEAAQDAIAAVVPRSYRVEWVAGEDHQP